MANVPSKLGFVFCLLFFTTTANAAENTLTLSQTVELAKSTEDPSVVQYISRADSIAIPSM